MKTLIKTTIILVVLFGLQLTIFAQPDVEEQPVYYLVTFDDLAQWLLETEAQHSTENLAQEITTADTLDENTSLSLTLEAVGTLFAEDWSEILVTSADSPTMRTLETLHALLAEALAEKDYDVQSFSVCLAVDNNPYSITGPGLYFYMELPAIPEDFAPTSWELLSAPRNDSPTWSTECFSGQTNTETTINSRSV